MYQLLSPQSSTTSTFLSSKNSHSWQQNHFFIIASIRRLINNRSPLQFYHHLSRCTYTLCMPERNTIGGHTSNIGAAYTDAGISASFFLFFVSWLISYILIVSFFYSVLYYPQICTSYTMMFLFENAHSSYFIFS